MQNISSSSHQYTTLNGTLPYAYGESVFQVLSARAKFLFGRHIQIQNPMKDEFIEQNKKAILKAWRRQKADTTIVQLPFQKIFLQDAVEEGYIKISKGNSPREIMDQAYNPNLINYNHLSLDLKRDLILTLIIGGTKFLLEAFNFGFNDTIAWKCALVLGIVKGISKTIADQMVYKKPVPLPKTLLRCIIDVCAEMATALCLRPASPEWNPAFKGAVKGLFKNIFKHLFQNLLILFTFTELCIETFKASLKAAFRFYGYSILGKFLGPVAGSLFSALLVNIFIDQCTLSPAYQ